LNEFELIRRYFATQPLHRDDVIVGIGDDAAVLRVPHGHELVATTDSLVAGVHFLPDADPGAIGHKALAVNLSDLAAMGAEPAWFLLSLTLPEADPAWLQAFSNGLHDLARQYRIQLVGGNIARGPLAITITAHGFVPEGQALRRNGAHIGDRIYVTGELGDAGLVLRQRWGRLRLSAPELASIGDRLDRPRPRIEQGITLRGLASSLIDISDGLLADLGHILEVSRAGARLGLERIPVSSVYRAHLHELGWDMALAHGDDYELCFTVPTQKVIQLEQLASDFGCRLTYIGDIVAGSDLQIVDAVGRLYQPGDTGYDHFGEQQKKIS
jgi:thiamine-monophosphate kinase